MQTICSECELRNITIIILILYWYSVRKESLPKEIMKAHKERKGFLEFSHLLFGERLSLIPISQFSGKESNQMRGF